MQNENDEFVWPFPSIMEVYDRIQTTLPIEEMGIDILPVVTAMGEISWIKVSYYTRGHPLSQYPIYPSIHFYCKSKEIKKLCKVLNAAECDYGWEYCFFDLKINYTQYTSTSQLYTNEGWLSLVLETKTATSLENAAKRLALGFNQQSSGLKLNTTLDEDVSKMRQLGFIK